MISPDFQAALDRIDAATNADAAVITGLRAQVKTGMTDAEVATVQAKLGDLATHLEAIGKDPTPPPAPAPVPAP